MESSPLEGAAQAQRTCCYQYAWATEIIRRPIGSERVDLSYIYIFIYLYISYTYNSKNVYTYIFLYMYIYILVYIYISIHTDVSIQFYDSIHIDDSNQFDERAPGFRGFGAEALEPSRRIDLNRRIESSS